MLPSLCPFSAIQHRAGGLNPPQGTRSAVGCIGGHGPLPMRPNTRAQWPQRARARKARRSRGRCASFAPSPGRGGLDQGGANANCNSPYRCPSHRWTKMRVAQGAWVWGYSLHQNTRRPGPSSRPLKLCAGWRVALLACGGCADGFPCCDVCTEAFKKCWDVYWLQRGASALTVT